MVATLKVSVQSLTCAVCSDAGPPVTDEGASWRSVVHAPQNSRLQAALATAGCMFSHRLAPWRGTGVSVTL